MRAEESTCHPLFAMLKPDDVYCMSLRCYRTHAHSLYSLTPSSPLRLLQRQLSGRRTMASAFDALDDGSWRVKCEAYHAQWQRASGAATRARAELDHVRQSMIQEKAAMEERCNILLRTLACAESAAGDVRQQLSTAVRQRDELYDEVVQLRKVVEQHRQPQSASFASHSDDAVDPTRMSALQKSNELLQLKVQRLEDALVHHLDAAFVPTPLNSPEHHTLDMNSLQDLTKLTPPCFPAALEELAGIQAAATEVSESEAKLNLCIHQLQCSMSQLMEEDEAVVAYLGEQFQAESQRAASARARAEAVEEALAEQKRLVAVAQQREEELQQSLSHMEKEQHSAEDAHSQRLRELESLVQQQLEELQQGSIYSSELAKRIADVEVALAAKEEVIAGLQDVLGKERAEGEQLKARLAASDGHVRGTVAAFSDAVTTALAKLNKSLPPPPSFDAVVADGA